MDKGGAKAERGYPGPTRGDMDGSSLLVIGTLTAKSIGVVWGLAATWYWLCTNHINQVNSHSGIGDDDSTLNIIPVLLLLLTTKCRT